jgi:hypothetical protein
MNKFANQLIHDFMYDNISKYSWHIVDMFDCLLAAFLKFFLQMVK